MTLEIYTVDELAKRLGCASTTIEEHARRGLLPGLKFGDGGWIFPAGATDQRLNELALEQAADRRKPPPKPSGVVRALPTSKRAKKAPPALPSLPMVEGLHTSKAGHS